MRLYDCLLQACYHLETVISKKEQKKLKESAFRDLSAYHFTLGVWIRNTMLEENSALQQAFLNCNVWQKDDMSMVLIRAFYIYLQEK